MGRRRRSSRRRSSLGVAADHIGGAQRINILALAGAAARHLEPRGLRRARRRLRRALRRRRRAGTHSPRGGAAGRRPDRLRGPRESADPMRDALATFARDWSARAAPLYAARAARILHLAAAAFALGVIARPVRARPRLRVSRHLGEHVPRCRRRCGRWSRSSMRPARWSSGIVVPDAAHIAAIRAPASENAAPWLHLMAATLAVVVIVPRLVLALGMWLVERYRAARVGEDLERAVLSRLLRDFREGPVAVQVMPYSFAVTPAAVAALEALLARALGAGATLAVAAPVAYGDEDAAAAGAPRRTRARGRTVQCHGHAGARGAWTHSSPRSRERPRRVRCWWSSTRQRSTRAGATIRRGERRARRLWRDACAEERLAPVFVDLARPGLGCSGRSGRCGARGSRCARCAIRERSRHDRTVARSRTPTRARRRSRARCSPRRGRSARCAARHDRGRRRIR